MNQLLYGDCLELMKDLPDESVDLIYLDPPFKSDTDYNMLFGSEQGEDMAQARAFEDTWYWKADCEIVLGQLTIGNYAISNAVGGLYAMLGKCGIMAYLLFMAERLVQMQRILKTTGSLYLHCDTTACHYLKILLDNVFGSNAYRNDITWRRATAHNDARRFGRISDRILFYTKSDNFCWNGEAVMTPRSPKEILTAFPYEDERGRFRSDNLTGPSHGPSKGESAKPWNGYDIISRGRVWSAPKTGRYADYIDENLIPGYKDIKGVHDRLNALDEAGLITHPQRGFWPGLKRYADADRGNPVQDIILEPIGFTNYSTTGGEYLGYPTQKPLGLLEKLIRASSNEGEVILDPFCGCGTAVVAAQRDRRQWIGMDISCLAINVIRDRLIQRHSIKVMDEIEVRGLPRDMTGARDLFNYDPFEFERWAVDLVGGKPNDKQVGDGGSDGLMRFAKGKGLAPLSGIVSVKGGARISPGMVRDLVGAVETLDAAMGVLVVLAKPSTAMIDTAHKGGNWIDPITKRHFPKIQIITIEALLAGERPNMPTPLPPYTKAEYRHDDQLGMEV